MHALATPIAYLKGVGPKRSEMLEKDLGIRTYEAFFTTTLFVM